jgi:hypothetical protein
VTCPHLFRGSHERRRKDPIEPSRTNPAERWTRAVERQIEHGKRGLGKHPEPIRFVGGNLSFIARIVCKAVNRFEFGLLFRGERGIQGAKVFENHRKRPAVADDMVGREHHKVLFVAKTDNAGPEERPVF